MLNQKWRDLIKQHTDVDAKAFTVGDNQLLVKPIGLDAVLSVMGFFTEQGKSIDVREEGLLITLD
ncbi:hypothetical protein NVP1215B_036 [Vibrio phage 1.215.B._10N.222.54.F7]|nr:hypothetical protein NVP1215A_036 [Vibrio phage 1.215.A._10N.222.54.F7]AUR96059.1 hypothetical protein NVP1215B_036 [Vibrio phage 1.215.B._10N.222.54.F7]